MQKDNGLRIAEKLKMATWSMWGSATKKQCFIKNWQMYKQALQQLENDKDTGHWKD